MADDNWTIGNLPVEYYGPLETMLARSNLVYPIMRPDHIAPHIRPILSSFDTHAQNCIDRMIARHQIKAEIRRCFLVTTTLNAFAARPLVPSTSQGVYVVGLLGGVTTLLPSAFFKISKDAAVREFLGLPCPEGGISGADRQKDYDELMGVGYRWLIYHELGHIKNGHVNLDSDAFGGCAFERVSLDAEEQRNLTRHTLEMDADSVANGWCIGELFSPPYDDPNFSAMLRTDQLRLRAFAVAVFVTLRTFDDFTWSEDLMFRYTHPPAGVRMVSLMKWGEAYLNLHPEKGTVVDWLNDCGNACRLVDAAFGRIVRDDPVLQTRLFETLIGGGSRRPGYFKQLLQRWALIRPKLEPHLLGGVLALPQEEPA